MELELVKVEEGLCDGRVLYHAYMAKTPEEAAELEVGAVQKRLVSCTAACPFSPGCLRLVHLGRLGVYRL